MSTIGNHICTYAHMDICTQYEHDKQSHTKRTLRVLYTMNNDMNRSVIEYT